MNRIVNQMLHIAQYLEWDPTELRPVSFRKHGVTSKRQVGQTQDLDTSVYWAGCPRLIFLHAASLGPHIDLVLL